MKINPENPANSKSDVSDDGSTQSVLGDLPDFKVDQPRRLSKAQINWGKVRMATKSMGALNAVKAELKTLGKEVRKEEASFMQANHRLKGQKFILHPKSPVRQSWEALIVLLLVYIMVAVPIRVAFDVFIERHGFTNYFDVLIDVMFLMDIVLNCFSGYYDGETGDVIMDQRKILKKYLKSWFLLDVIASIPLSIFIDGRFSFFKLFRLLKLLRVFRLKRYMNVIEFHLGINVIYTRLFKVFIGVFFATHVVGCFWYATFWIDLNENSWVVRYDLEDASLSSKYLASIYWAFSTLTTVGFGDISAATDLERAFATVCMVIGVSWYAFVISTFSSILAMFDRHEAKKRQDLSLVIQFLRDSNVPKSLRNKILTHVEYSNQQPNASTEKDLPKVLLLLSSQLKTQLLMFINRHLIGQITILRNKTPQMIVQCMQGLKPLVVNKDDIIINMGQHCEELYFLLKGSVIFHLDFHSKLKVSVPEGSLFGEIGCIFDQRATEAVKAHSKCSLLRLSKGNLWSLMHDFPDFGDEVKGLAKSRLRKFKEMRARVKDTTTHVKISFKDVIAKLKQEKDMKTTLSFDDENNPLVVKSGKTVYTKSARNSEDKPRLSKVRLSNSHEDFNVQKELSEIKSLLNKLLAHQQKTGSDLE